MKVKIAGSEIVIEDSVFRLLLENSVAGTYAAFERAIQSGAIAYDDLEMLCTRGEIPLPLFFGPLPLVEAQVAAKTEKLLAGVSKKAFSIGSRATVELRDVELIVKDLIRKQELLKAHDRSLKKNAVVGLLPSTSISSEADAERLMSAIGLSSAQLQVCRTKHDALELFIDRLEANQLFVSRSVRTYMPQRLDHVQFSGMTIRDSKVPFIFLAGGEHADQQEPVGRTVYTLALLTVMVAKRIFAPLTWDGGTTTMQPGGEYDVAGAMLMPRQQMKSLDLSSLRQVEKAADLFKVSPSAVAVRSIRLGLISTEIASGYIEALRAEFRNKAASTGRRPIAPANAVRKYAGRELSRRMLRALDAKSITTGEFLRAVCLNRLSRSQISDLRRAVG